MGTRGERESAKSQNAKHTKILNELMTIEENKYCVECHAKGQIFGGKLTLF